MTTGLKVIKSISMTDAMLVGTNVPENEHPTYNAGATYASARASSSTTRFTNRCRTATRAKTRSPPMVGGRACRPPTGGSRSICPAPPACN